MEDVRMPKFCLRMIFSGTFIVNYRNMLTLDSTFFNYLHLMRYAIDLRKRVLNFVEEGKQSRSPKVFASHALHL